MTSSEHGPVHQFDYLQESLVVITPLVEEYAPALFGLIDRNKKHLSQYGDSTARKYPTEESVSISITNPINPMRERYIVLSRGIVAGSINLTPVAPDAKVMELGYWIGEEFSRQGLASTAATMLSDHVLTRPNIDEVVAFTHPKNTFSKKTLLKAGFIYLGIMDDDQRKFAKH